MARGMKTNLVIERDIHAAISAAKGLYLRSRSLQGKDSFILAGPVEGQIPENAHTFVASLVMLASSHESDM